MTEQKATQIKVEKSEIYDNLPDGRYEARVESAEYRLSKAGKPMVVFEFVITEGFFERRHVWLYSVIKEDISPILEDAAKLGICADSIEELKERLELVKDKPANITLKTSMYRGKPSQFTYICDIADITKLESVPEKPHE